MFTFTRKLSLEQLFIRKKDTEFQQYLADTSIHISSSGRLGLLALLRKIRFDKDDYILLPPICPEGIVLPISKLGICIQHYHLIEFFKPNFESIKRLIGDGHCKAIFHIHYFGMYQTEIKELQSLCNQHGILLFEDCVHGMFSTDDEDKPIGSKGDVAIFSLTKFLPVPDGAFFYINNPNLNVAPNTGKASSWNKEVVFHLLYLLSNNIIYSSKWTLVQKVFRQIAWRSYKYYYSAICKKNSNSGMSSISEKLLSNHDIDLFIKTKNEIFRLYNSLLCNYEIHNGTIVSTGYPLLMNPWLSLQLKEHLRAKGVECLNYVVKWDYIPQKPEFDYERKLLMGHLLLPLDINMTPRDIEEVSMLVKEFLLLHNTDSMTHAILLVNR
jgi:dTDP-4-amino-4,6-dideoxygalactose transaminase